AQRQDAVDRRPVGMFDDAVEKILLGFLLGRPAGDDAGGIAADLAAMGAGGIARLLRALRGLGEGPARRLEETRVAILHRESLAGRRSAGIHDHGARAAIGLR